jgi:predicted GNAT family acetyltransferase
VFSSVVTEHWLPSGAPTGSTRTGAHRVLIDDTLPANRPLRVLELDAGDRIVTLTSVLAERLGLRGRTDASTDELSGALAAAGVRLNGPDNLFFLPTQEHAVVLSEPGSPDTRQLTETDADAFADFTARAPVDELDEAFVELDHWLVVGTFVDERLVSAASMYPWQGSQLADVGVITLPTHRGRGLARATVRAICAEALRRGYEPQYRCQLDNTPSVALAQSAGFARLGTCDVIDEAG